MKRLGKIKTLAVASLAAIAQAAPHALAQTTGQDNQPPMPKLGLICKAGADADDLHNRIQGLLNMNETPEEVRQRQPEERERPNPHKVAARQPVTRPGHAGKVDRFHRLPLSGVRSRTRKRERKKSAKELLEPPVNTA